MMTTQLTDESHGFETVIAIVMRGALEECGPDGCPIHTALDACTRDAVRRF